MDITSTHELEILDVSVISRRNIKINNSYW